MLGSAEARPSGDRPWAIVRSPDDAPRLLARDDADRFVAGFWSASGRLFLAASPIGGGPGSVLSEWVPDGSWRPALSLAGEVLGVATPPGGKGPAVTVLEPDRKRLALVGLDGLPIASISLGSPARERAWAASGTAVRSEDGTLAVFDAGLAPLGTPFRFRKRLDELALAPGPDHVFGFGRDPGVWSVDLPAGEPWSVGREGLATRAVIPLGLGGAVCGWEDGAVTRFDASSRQVLWTTEAEPGCQSLVIDVAIGTGRVVSGSSSGKVRALDLLGGAGRWEIDVGTGTVEHVLILGGWVIAAGANEVLSVLDLASGEARAHLFGHRHRITHLTPSALGSGFISADKTGRILAWDLAGG